jgi:23S rRNA (adenine2503-C2)-methyltransferase
VRPTLIGASRDELGRLMEDRGEPRWRAGSLFRWLHAGRATTFETMSDLPVSLRRGLAERFSTDRPAVHERHTGADGATRWVLGLEDDLRVESVFIPHGDRITLCLSSQAGCRFGCSFCATARMGLQRNLSPAEIVGQCLVLLAGHEVAPGTPFNVVFMGMGEPMDALDPVLSAFDILTDADGFGLSWRRVTLSTVGHVPGIRRLAARPHRPRLSLSLNATTDEQRDRIMPINRRWPLDALRDAMRDFPVRPGERMTLEYVLLAGENDSPGDAARLARFAAGLPARINLIPWNENAGMPHRRPADGDVERFRDAIRARGGDVAIRFSRGRDVGGGCGQLVTAAPGRVAGELPS